MVGSGNYKEAAMASQEACAQLLDQLPAIGEIKRQFHRAGPVVGSLGTAGAIPTLAILATTGEQRASDLAEQLRIDLSVVSRQVAALIDAGLVARAADPTDRRVHRLAITDEGLATFRHHRERMGELISRGLADWSDEDVVVLASSLRRFADSLAGAVTRRPAPAGQSGGPGVAPGSDGVTAEHAPRRLVPQR
jgi:DNA-binding MarR family transcriptional regulator